MYAIASLKTNNNKEGKAPHSMLGDLKTIENHLKDEYTVTHKLNTVFLINIYCMFLAKGYILDLFSTDLLLVVVLLVTLFYFLLAIIKWCIIDHSNPSTVWSHTQKCLSLVTPVSLSVSACLLLHTQCVCPLIDPPTWVPYVKEYQFMQLGYTYPSAKIGIWAKVYEFHYHNKPVPVLEDYSVDVLTIKRELYNVHITSLNKKMPFYMKSIPIWEEGIDISGDPMVVEVLNKKIAGYESIFGESLLKKIKK